MVFRLVLQIPTSLLPILHLLCLLIRVLRILNFTHFVRIILQLRIVASHRHRDLFYQLEQVHALTGTSIHDVCPANVVKVKLEDLGAEKLNKSLNVVGHLFVSRALLQTPEIDVREGRRKELNIERVCEEHVHVVDELLDTQIGQCFVSEIENTLNNCTDIKND